MRIIFNISINHREFGKILEENFIDSTQVKLFLKSVHTCLELKEDFSFFDGETFLIHIPHPILRESIITTKNGNFEYSEAVERRTH